MVIPEVMGQVLFLLGVATVGLLIQRLTRLDITLSALIAGVLSGLLLPHIGFDTGIRATNIKDLVFYVILPILIFEAAWHLKPVLLRRWLLPILLLSTLGMLISCGVVAVILFYAIGAPEGFPWLAALLAGAILAATDPISVVSSLKKHSAPEDLTTLVEGESLFNDASALVLFAAVLSFAVGTQIEINQNYISVFLEIFFGGLLLGLLIGLAGVIVVLVLRDKTASNIVLILIAFASFYIAEHYFHVSGIMAVVSAALLSRVLLQEYQQKYVSGIVITLDWLGLTFNSIIFVLMGLVITFDMFTERWLAMLIAIPAALFGRACAVYGCGALTRLLPHPVALGWQHVLVWGGQRGAIAIVLVLSLPVSLPYWWTVQSMVYGVVLFSLLVQGSTAFAVIKKYKA